MSQRVIKERFELEREIASRSACKVYLGRDRQIGGKEIAVKIFLDKPKSDETRLFEQEVEALRRATHPVLIPIVDGGLEGDELFLALEFIPGETLRDRIKSLAAPMEVDEAVQLISQLAEAVNEIHGEKFQSKQLIHGHLDSRAILFKGKEPRLGGYHPVAIDLLQKQMTSVARVAADAGYISPEQLSGSEEVDGRADVYALGVLLYELIAGERPFVAANPLQAAMLRLTVTPQAPSKKNPKISPLTDAAVLKALAKDPKERFQTAMEFREALLGNQRASKNPFYSQAEGAGRISSETLAVSVSTADIQKMLAAGGAGAAVSTSSTSATAQPVSSQLPDSSQTVMGLDTSSVLKPGVLFLSGKRRGERISLDKTQMFLGSDPTCDIVVKGASNRHLLLLQRDGKTFVCAISAKGVDVSGNTLKSEEERALNRGDVIEVGEEELRYLAPGEVFTLKDDEVSHQAAKPGGKGAKLLLISTLLIGVIALTSLYFWRQSIDRAKQQARAKQIEQGKQRSAVVKNLIQEGDDLFKSGALFAPVGENALEKFQEVLSFEPDNSYAKRRIEDISRRKSQLEQEEERRQQMQGRITELLQQGDYYLAQNQLVAPPGKNAKESYSEVLKIDPTNPVARQKIAEIDRMLGDVLGRVKESLQFAKEHIQAGRFIEPEGENALERIREIQQVDPENREAKDLILQMAALSLIQGDEAKERKAVKDVRRNYLVAQSLGVDPKCIEIKMKGLDIIARSTGKVVLQTSGDECPANAPGFLDSGELTKRVAKLKLERELRGQ